MRVLVLLLAFACRHCRGFPRHENLRFRGGKRFSASSLDNVTLADADKKVIVMASKPADGPYLSISDQSVTIHDGENPIVLTGDAQASFLKGVPVAYGEGGVPSYSTPPMRIFPTSCLLTTRTVPCAGWCN